MANLYCTLLHAVGKPTDKFGGYLIYRFEGRRKVFFDGRSDFYPCDAPIVREHGQGQIAKRLHITLLQQLMTPYLKYPALLRESTNS